jgi:hypothetical protein
MNSRRVVILFLLPAMLAPVAAVLGQERDTVRGDTVVVGAADSAAPAPIAIADTTELTTSIEAAESRAAEAQVRRAAPDSVLSQWRKDPHYAYANDPTYWRPPKPTEEDNAFLLWLARVLSSDGFRYFIYFLLGGLLLYAIIRIMAEHNLGIFYRNRAKKARLVKAAEEAQAEEDPEERAAHFIREKDHRQAIRYLYLQSLRLLSEAQLIRWHPQTTNQEYIRQLAGARQEQAFRFLTGVYEKVWYGEFALGEDHFEQLHQHFRDLFKTLQP